MLRTIAVLLLLAGCAQDGTKGPAGSDGADGAEGARGPQGATGAQGLEGPRGQPGSCNFSKTNTFAVTAAATVTHGNSTLVVARCSDVDDVVMGGGCGIAEGLTVSSSYPYQPDVLGELSGWACFAYSTSLLDLEARAWALCYRPSGM